MEQPIDVLVVEDEALMRRSIMRRLENAEGFRVAGEARSGREALQLVELLRPQAVFTDIVMPEMDGLELARQLQTSKPQIQVVIVSGYRDFDHAQNAMRYGVKNYLLKPLEDGALNEVLENLRSSVISSRAGARRERLEILLAGEQTDENFEGKHFMLMATLGPVLKTAPPMDLVIALKQGWSRMLSRADLPRSEGVLSILPGRYENERFFILTDDGNMDARTYATKLFAFLTGMAAEKSVTLVYSEKPAPDGVLYELRTRLLSVQSVRMMLGQSGIYCLERLPERSEEVSFEAKELALWKALLTDDCKELLHREMELAFRHIIENGCTQVALENVLGRCFWTLNGDSDWKLAALQREVNLHLAEIGDMEKLPLYLADTMQNGLFAAEEKTDAEPELVRRVKDYLKAHFNEELSMEAMAAQMGFSLPHLTRVFRQYGDISPLKYLISLRMERACELLRDYPQMDIARVGEICGYSDPHYFSRIFKNTFGMSPMNYREQSDK